MDRKKELKKIENITRCQVTFSKRRSSLMKKVREISTCCDAEVAFIAFSPSGRVSKFCSQIRIEDTIHRYVNLPTDKRYTHIKNVQEKLRQLDHIKGHSTKLLYLDKQIENLELQIRKSSLELQILENDIRDYEPLPEQDPSQHQLLWCERNLKKSLERVVARKNALVGSHTSSQSHPNVQVEMETENRRGTPHLHEFEEKAPSSGPENAGDLIMQLDPWISPHSAKFRESIIQGLVDQSQRTPMSSQSTALQQQQNHMNKQDPAISMPQSNSNTKYRNWFPSDYHVICYTNLQRTIPLAANGPFVAASASTSKGLDIESLGSLQAQIVLDQCQPENNTVENESMFFNPNPTLTQQKNVKQINQPSSEKIQSNSNNNVSGCANEHNSPQKVLEASSHDSLPFEDNVEDNKLWTKGIQESGLWEWDDLLMVDNMNFDDLENFC